MFGIFNVNYSIVFQNFYQSGGYNQMGFLLFGISLVSLLLFYFLWKYPYGTLTHWIIYIVIIALIIGGSTFGAVRLVLANSLVNPEPQLADFTNLLVIKYSLLNAFLSLLVSFIYSLLLKQFSKVQMHLPF
ncbi:hypothetical protein O4H26_09280 [Aequorivita viscosa]|nr:hypothetical protein [Aequorivita viscosa]